MNNSINNTTEIINKMSGILKENILCSIKECVKKSGYTAPTKQTKNQIIDEILKAIDNLGTIYGLQLNDPFDCLITFNSNSNDIFMTVCTLDSGTSFRYKVNNFDELNLVAVKDYITLSLLTIIANTNKVN